MTNEEIRRHLFELADEKYQSFHQNLCPGIEQIIGVRIPKLRDFAKELAKGNWQDYLEGAWQDYNEEIMLQGLVIGYIKTDIDVQLTYLSKYIPKINSWATCDSPVMGMKFIKKNQERVLQFLAPYLRSQQEYEVRFGVVALLDYYVDKEHIEYVFSVLENVKHEGYYVKMAVAWTLCECYIKFPNETNAFLKYTKMDVWSYNKGIQKITESRRISKEEKLRLKTMKK